MKNEPPGLGDFEYLYHVIMTFLHMNDRFPFGKVLPLLDLGCVFVACMETRVCTCVPFFHAYGED